MRAARPRCRACFAGGDCTTTPYKQIVVALGEGSRAALGAFEHMMRTPVIAQATAVRGLIAGATLRSRNPLPCPPWASCSIPSREYRVPASPPCLALLAAPASRADDAHVFWEVAGQHNTVYLLGSVHVLSATDHALPTVTEGAYRNAEVLVEELDLSSVASDLLTPEVMAQTMLPQGQSLSTVLGPELNEQLRAAAKPLGLDLDFTNRMQPWYVASLVSSLRLMKAGYSPQDGVDFQIAERAKRDGKPIEGLETTAQQLGFLASLPMEQQRQFLAATLADATAPRNCAGSPRPGGRATSPRSSRC